MNAHELDCKCEELGSSFQSFWMMIASGVYHEDVVFCTCESFVYGFVTPLSVMFEYL